TITREHALEQLRARFTADDFSQFVRLCEVAGDLNDVTLQDHLRAAGLFGLLDLKQLVRLRRHDVLAKIYAKADDPDGYELLMKLERDRDTAFRFLPDLTEFLIRYEAFDNVMSEPAKRGPKPKHSASDIKKMVKENPGKTQRQIAAMLNCSVATVNAAVKNGR